MDKRKGLMTSITSQASSTMLNTSVPTTQKLIEFSVDDVFARYTVPQVQKLHKDYHQDITRAKDELHLLVGGKYRDLIRIAEEIDTMSTTAYKLDNTLADLSFKSSNYITFGNNKFSKFDSVVRKENVHKARQASQMTILNNVINNELIGYDLKLQTDSLRRTHYLIHLAKIYYTIEKLFADIIPSNDHKATSYKKLKDNFVSYLERKLAHYTFTGDSLSNTSGLHNVDDIIQKTENNQWLEDETFDFLSEEQDDEYYQYSDLDSKTDSLTNASSVPIVNYILAYIIVNHDGEATNSLRSITSRIIDLRTAHLQTLARDVSKHPQVSNTNFHKLFRFIESTAVCVNEYLANDGEIKTRLKSLKAWKASQLIGFHSWFENDEISFDINMELAGSLSFEESLVTYYNDSGLLLDNLISDLYQASMASHDTDTAASTKAILSVLYNFLSGASKLQALASYEESKCYSSESVLTEDLISSIIKLAFEHVEKATQSHLHNLTEGDSSVLLSLNSMIREANLDSCHDNDFFSNEIISSMEEDIETYLGNVLRLASLSSTKSEHSLSSWLLTMRSILLETKSQEDNIIKKIEKILNKSSESSSIKRQASSFSNKLHGIYQSIIKDLGVQLDVFVSGLAGELASDGNEEKDLVFGVLSYILEVKQFIQKTLKNDSESIVKKIDDLLHELYDHILISALNSKVGDKTVEESLAATIRSSSTIQDSDSSRRAETPVHSILFGLVEELLDLDRFEQQRVVSFFTNKNTAKLFSSQKNRHILRIVDEGLTAPHTNSGNDENGIRKISTAQAEQLLANILFLLNFTQTLTIKSNDEVLQAYLQKVNSVAELDIELPIVESIARGVSEQYKATKDIFLPLLAF